MTRKGIETTKEDAPASRMEGSNGPGTYASPPCFMHELDPSYFGQMSCREMLTLLNSLLEAERAGARGVGEMSKRATSAESHSLLRSVAKHEATFCAMLTRHLVRLGGVPSTRTGAFYEKLAAVEPGRAQLDLLNRGQGWVVRELRKALPKIGDERLHKDLMEMLQVHQRNIEECDNLDF